MHKGAYGNFRFIVYSVRSLSEVICIILLRGEEYRYFLIKRKPNYAATVLIGCLRPPAGILPGRLHMRDESWEADYGNR